MRILYEDSSTMQLGSRKPTMLVTVTLQVIDWLLVWRCSDSHNREFTAVSGRATALSRVPAITLPPTLLGCDPSRNASARGPFRMCS